MLKNIFVAQSKHYVLIVYYNNKNRNYSDNIQIHIYFLSSNEKIGLTCSMPIH